MNERIKKFIFGFIAVLLLLNLIFSKKINNNSYFNNYTATFNKIDGVNKGTDVVISGIKVGQVNEVFIKETFPQISFSIEKNINISYDSSVSIQTDGLFGRKFLLIEVGGSDKFLRNGDKFSFTEDSIVIEELLQKIIKIGETNKKL